jgi:hypothetical protein
MANEFWMNERQWAVLEPLIPMNRRGVKPQRNREIISGILHVLKGDVVGAIVRKCTVRTPPSTIGSTDGRRRAFGRRCSKRWWILERPDRRASTAQPPRLTAVLPAEKAEPKSRRSVAAAADGQPKSMPSPTLLAV